MSDLARVRLQQARVHMQSGNATKAAELLEQARVLARADRVVLVPILQDLVQVYNTLGRRRQADLCADELRTLAPAVPATGPQLPLPLDRPRSTALPILLVSAIVLLIGSAGVIVWMAASLHYDERPTAAASQPAPPQPPAAVVPVPAPAMAPVSGPVVPANAVFPPVPQPISVLPAAAPAAASAEKDRATMVKDGVGLVIQVARYQGPANGRNCQAELPISTGTCFAVSHSGLMLTNRHVASLPPEGVPATLEGMKLPTMILQGVATIVCFGSEPSSHYEANVLHLSNQYDAALLKVNRTFSRPFPLGLGPGTLGEQVFVCGYPGAVGLILAQANAMQIASKFVNQAATGNVPYTTWFDKGVFDPTLTAGIVSSPQRELANVSYIQIDAKVSGGNSGGPLLNRNNEVVGMVTLGGSTLEAQGYNFALSFPQIMNEIRPYLQAP